MDLGSIADWVQVVLGVLSLLVGILSLLVAVFLDWDRFRERWGRIPPVIVKFIRGLAYALAIALVLVGMLLLGMYIGSHGGESEEPTQQAKAPVTITVEVTREVTRVVEVAASADLPTPAPCPTHAPCPTATPLPTYTPCPTHTPYPTFTPQACGETKESPSDTPSPPPDQQDPPPGSIISAGASYTLRGIDLTMHPEVQVRSERINVQLDVHNSRSQSYVLRFAGNVFHLRDDTGREYPIHFWNPLYERETFQVSIEAGGWHYVEIGLTSGYVARTQVGYFVGPISVDAQYLVLTVDEMAGMTNLNWQYDLQ